MGDSELRHQVSAPRKRKCTSRKPQLQRIKRFDPTQQKTTTALNRKTNVEASSKSTQLQSLEIRNYCKEIIYRATSHNTYYHINSIFSQCNSLMAERSAQIGRGMFLPPVQS
uniref:Putative secreted protein n=1 Tax=Ixodes ricinus TaxID=34613 RepID=A0A0K8RD61_IXORI